MGRPPTCICGTCALCIKRVQQRERYQAMSLEERREFVARRDVEKVRAADRARYARDRDKRLAAMAEYRTTEQGRAALARANALWIKHNPEKRSAQNAASNAVRDGRLEKPWKCERAGDDCRGRIESHHDDYSKPLEVRWLCKAHHIEADVQRRAA